jgi:hypothetical protein
MLTPKPVRKWMRKHPIFTLIIAFMLFLVYQLPPYVASVWALKSSRPLATVLSEKLSTFQVPHFSLSWITTPIGLIGIFVIIYLLVTDRREVQANETLPVDIQQKDTRIEELESENANLKAARETDAIMIRQYSAKAERLGEEVTDLGRFNNQHKWLYEIADFDRQNIQTKAIVIECKARPHLSDDVPNIEFEIVVVNASVYEISVEDSKRGYIVFNKHRLNGNNLELISNRIKNLKPGQNGQIRLRQQLIPAEITLVSNGLEDEDATFFLSNFDINVVGKEGRNISPQRLNVPDAIPARDATERLKDLELQYKSDIGELRINADKIYRLSLLYGMALQAQHIVSFFNDTLTQEQVKYLDAHINSGIQNCLGTPARDSYYERVPPVPNSAAGQEDWIRSHCGMLEALIKHQQQLVAQ